MTLVVMTVCSSPSRMATAVTRQEASTNTFGLEEVPDISVTGYHQLQSSQLQVGDGSSNAGPWLVNFKIRRYLKPRSTGPVPNQRPDRINRCNAYVAVNIADQQDGSTRMTRRI
jgi:hypothetical protein